jgi:hypothetical protein
MTMPRVVVPETLDGLAETDPAAMRSRRDLQRIHRLMGTRRILTRALKHLIAPVGAPDGQPLRILELGAGDGQLMLGVARALERSGYPAVDLTLLDRQDLVSSETIGAYAEMGWYATSQVVDVLDWATGRGPVRRDRQSRPFWDVIVCNLFLHHFEGSALLSLLDAIEARSAGVMVCEPRRSRLALAGAHLVGLIGANAVTRKDAVLSVHAGFRSSEIFQLWEGRTANWMLKEYSGGLFSHCFCAKRNNTLLLGN